MRTPPAFLNFVLRLQYRALTNGAHGAVLIRTSPFRPGDWPGSGLRIGLDTTGKRPLGVISAYEGEVQQATGVVAASPKATGVWSDVEVRAQDNRISVAIDGTTVQEVAVTGIWAGYIGFAAERGTMEYRGFSVTSTDVGTDCVKSALEMGLVVVRPKLGVRLPLMLTAGKPRYTADAMGRQVQGAVLLEAVVLPDGSVGPVCVVKSLDPDLDASALAAAKAFRFSPGSENEKPVPVLVRIELTFTLK